MSRSKLLLVFPTKSESGKLTAKAKKIATFPEVYKYNSKTDILISGIGILHTAYSLTKTLLSGEYGFVIAAGIAGTFVAGDKLTEVVNIISETAGDTGVEENNVFTSLFEMGLINPDEHIYEKGVIHNNNLPAYFQKLRKVKGTTVNMIYAGENKNRTRSKITNADVETMEGIAVFYVCRSENIPFVQIRALSNYAGERNKSKWKLKESVENLENFILDYLQNID